MYSNLYKALSDKRDITCYSNVDELLLTSVKGAVHSDC